MSTDPNADTEPGSVLPAQPSLDQPSRDVNDPRQWATSGTEYPYRGGRLEPNPDTKAH